MKKLAASIKSHKKFTTSLKKLFLLPKKRTPFFTQKTCSFLFLYKFFLYILLPIVKSLRRRWQKTHADNRSLEGGNSAIAVVQFDMAFGLDIHWLIVDSVAGRWFNYLRFFFFSFLSRLLLILIVYLTAWMILDISQFLYHGMRLPNGRISFIFEQLCI